jgi:uncharacterized protein
MAQTWRDLLFAHWRVARDALRRLVPETIELDTFDGTAWLAITPFEVTGLRLRGTPPVPGLSRFPELNVRTYVTVAGRPGVWFFSLDAGSAPAVVAARLTYRLPYHRADMTIARSNDRIRYDSRRARSQGELSAEYAPTGPAEPPQPGTLAHWLVERYCLYAVDGRQRVLRAEIHHPPWPLQPATATFRRNTMAPLTLPAEEPLLHFARRQDVVIWPPKTVTRG